MFTNRPLKVLMLDPSGSSVQVTHNLCNHLAAAGCDVHVFTAPHWLRALEGAEVQYKVHVCFYRSTQMRSYQARNKLSKLFWRCVRLAQHVSAMVSICSNAKEFDLVHTQILPVPVLDCLLLAWISRRVPAVCTVHELVPHGSKFRRLTGSALRAIYKVADLLFVYTEYTRRRLVEDGIKPEKIRVVPHGALEHLLRIQTPSRPASKQAPVALFIGNIRADKGVDVLVAAATYLRAMVANFKIVIAGTPGFDMTDLQRFATRNGLHECLEFRLGYLSDSEFVAYLRNADVVVLPYRRIEQSGVAVAACTFAKAIVATQCGGVAELVAEAANGLLVPVDDPSALAKAVAEILLSPEKRDHFERQSQRYATQVLGWQAITSKTLAGYRLALGQIEQSDNEALLEQACK